MGGRHIPLCSKFHTTQMKTVKVTVRDLPLHAMDNEQVLSVISEIFYGIVWHEGEPTSIRNGDCFFYVSEDAVKDLPDWIDISGYQGRLVRPAALSKCQWCNQVGHKSFDK